MARKLKKPKAFVALLRQNGEQKFEACADMETARRFVHLAHKLLREQPKCGALKPLYIVRVKYV